MLKHLRIIFLLTPVLLVTGCAVALIGIGAAVGTVAYKNGNLVKTYQAEYNRSVKASSDTLAGLKIPLTDNFSDDLKTVLKAKRPDGTPVEITVVRIARNLTEVGVRTGFVGVWDKRVSEQIQNSIAKKLSPGPRTASGYTADSDRKDISALNKESTPRVAAVNERNGTPVSNTPTDISSDREGQEVVKKPSKKQPDEVVKKPSKKQPDFVIYFSEDTNELSEDAIERLNTIAKVIINGPVGEVKVNGFSDSNGTSSFNKMISESRANSVKIYLIGKGIHPNKIIAKGFGSYSPVAKNKYKNSRKFNRRVEIELIYR